MFLKSLKWSALGKIRIMKTLQKLIVKDLYLLDTSPPLIVQAGQDITHVIKQFAQKPALRGIFVVDEEKHLVGVITRRDLLDWARTRIGASFRSTRDFWLAEDARLIRIMVSSSVSDIVHPDSSAAYVKLEDSLAQALRVMIEYDLICLPVIDDAGQIIGDLKLTEILHRIVQEEEGTEEP